MKKYSLTVNGKSYEIHSDKPVAEAFEELQTLDANGKVITIGGMPDVWKNNLDKVVEEDMTEMVEKTQRMQQKRKIFDTLISDESVLDNLIADLTARKDAAQE